MAKPPPPVLNSISLLIRQMSSSVPCGRLPNHEPDWAGHMGLLRPAQGGPFPLFHHNFAADRWRPAASLPLVVHRHTSSPPYRAGPCRPRTVDEPQCPAERGLPQERSGATNDLTIQ